VSPPLACAAECAAGVRGGRARTLATTTAAARSRVIDANFSHLSRRGRTGAGITTARSGFPSWRKRLPTRSRSCSGCETMSVAVFDAPARIAAAVSGVQRVSSAPRNRPAGVCCDPRAVTTPSTLRHMLSSLCSPNGVFRRRDAESVACHPSPRGAVDAPTVPESRRAYARPPSSRTTRRARTAGSLPYHAPPSPGALNPTEIQTLSHVNVRTRVDDETMAACHTHTQRGSKLFIDGERNSREREAARPFGAPPGRW
jgi:hypothetical protein